ncbi:MAG TPA: TetR/AcrR family transcriptional regulator [Acidimicrobiia bacterium]|nr:TetR/AcrR family transcriptional regulator [Acidimicrobiia bacterium]
MTGASAAAAPTSARVARTEAIVDAAARLFHERGFGETGIDDIGAAVGVTGPAVYRYFASKEELLVAVFDRAVQHAAGLAQAARADAVSPEDALWRAVVGAVDVCIADRVLTALYWNEARNLPAPHRRRVERAQRKMIDDFADILRGARPELDDSEARMAVYAASSLMRSVSNRATSLDEDALRRMLSSMAHAALLAAPARRD